MRLYDVKVRLAGSRENEVRKDNVTAAEIMILRAFHGVDSVEDIVPKEMDRRSHSDERKRLFLSYVGAEETGNLGGHMQSRAQVLIGLFGPSHTPLPVELPESESFIEEDAPKRTPIKARAGKAEDVANALA